MKMRVWIIVAIIGFVVMMIVVAIYYNRRKLELAKINLKASQIAGIGGFEIKIGGFGKDISDNMIGWL